MIKLPEPTELSSPQDERAVYGHSDATLKQSVRDALTLAFADCKALDNDENSDDFRQGAVWCGERIRALIKGIPE
jgi:hypothetical protein